MSAQYPIRVVAKLTGITVDTLRAWERRYEAVKPTRTDRGRLYDEAEVRRLVLLREAIERGHAIGQVASLSDEQLQELTAAPVHEPPPRPRQPLDNQDPPAELKPLLRAIETFDYTAANTELSRLALSATMKDLVHRIILPLMRIAGDRWERGTLQIAHEHMLSACVRNLLGGLLRLQGNGRSDQRMLFTTPIGELHEFGILAAAMLALSEQFEVSYLGPNLPAREILFAAAQSSPRAVVLAITQVNATAAVRDEVRQLALELPTGIELWLGGDGAGAVYHDRLRNGFLLLRDLKEFENHVRRIRSVEHLG